MFHALQHLIRPVHRPSRTSFQHRCNTLTNLFNLISELNLIFSPIPSRLGFITRGQRVEKSVCWPAGGGGGDLYKSMNCLSRLWVATIAPNALNYPTLVSAQHIGIKSPQMGGFLWLRIWWINQGMTKRQTGVPGCQKSEPVNGFDPWPSPRLMPDRPIPYWLTPH